MIEKIIKEFRINNGYTYLLGYDNPRMIYPRVEIYGKGKFLYGGCLNDKMEGAVYYIKNVNLDNSVKTIRANSITDMFMKLREYIEIPEEVEKKYEEIYLLYKLNDFREF